MDIRPIDANALTDDLQCYLNQEVIDGPYPGIVSDTGDGIALAMRIATEHPTITLNNLRDEIYRDAVAHGLWESTNYTVDNVLKSAERCGDPFDDPDGVLRSWAMEPIRKEVNELEMASESEDEYTEELADVIIICFSVAGKLGIDIDAAIKRKMAYNKTRPWKHGKE